MGKGAKKAAKVKATTAPKCTCEHPFTCTCGNRPERPSRGHKWDGEEQKWVGKGHKQKGASGQSAQRQGPAETTTSVGKTTVSNWQRMPSRLLREFCQKEKRPPPKMKALNPSKGYLYRVIVQDAKVTKRGGDLDMIFVPANSVENEEQAMEEACLLGLLHLTPSLPHERKLPEPYRTTWVNAIQDRKQQQKQQNYQKPQDKKNTNNNDASKPSSQQPNHTSNGGSRGGGGAVASSSLSQANTFTSRAEQKQQTLQRKQEKAAKIRKHEAIRMANRDHQVFMSAQMRKQIETILRSDSIDDSKAELLQSLLADNGEDSTIIGGDQEEEDMNQYDDDVVHAYVLQRLKHEGFTKSQVKAAYASIIQNDNNSDGDEDVAMERVYEECLQWLCIHLNEDQLPMGFDPRGRTLDVVIPTSQSGKVAPSSDSGELNKEGAASDHSFSKDIISLIMEQYGFSEVEAVALLQSTNGDENSTTLQNSYWSILSKITADTGSSLSSDIINPDIEGNEQIASDEIEVLRAIYPAETELNIQQGGSGTNTIINIALNEAGNYQDRALRIIYKPGEYPSVHPQTFVVGGWSKDIPSSNEGAGTTVHIGMVTFLASLPTGEPMIFELFSYVQELIQTQGEQKMPSSNSESRVLLHLRGGEPSSLQQSKEDSTTTSTMNTTEKKKDSNSKRKRSGKEVPTNSNQYSNEKSNRQTVNMHKRPRGRTPFWSKLPKETPPAKAFPQVSKMMEISRSRLPAAKAREDFLQLMKEADMRNRVVLVTGATGCGKTTQIPQFILEEAPSEAKIVVAQPRRLAATGVAGRVAAERGETKPGEGSVGYVVRGDVAMSKSTRLMFCTTGVLLRQLQSEGALDCITHIIVDEVHERHLDSDILLGILKEQLKKKKHLRVVLMSATMDADRFAAYWGSNTPRMFIPGFTHPVEDYTLEDVLRMTGYIPPKKKKKNFKGLGNYGMQQPGLDGNEGEEPVHNIDELVKRVIDIDYDLIGILVLHLIQNKDADDDGSILIFLPGAPEISRAEKSIQHIVSGVKIKLLPLYGGLQPREQQRVFDKVHNGTQKVILSTNIAETSITIPDVTMVIDACKEKQSTYDPSNRMPMLVEKFASRDSLKQRRGRAGRVRPGSCYKLISSNTLSKLPEHGEPEIKRSALDQTLLSLLFLGLEVGSGDFLSTLLDPPSQDSIAAAVHSLEKVGAVRISVKDANTRWNLTPLGMHLAGIPAPPTVGKLLVMGSLLGCRSAALAMAAGMSAGRSPFLKIDTFQYNRRRKNEEEEEEVSMEEIKNKAIIKERDELFKVVGNSDHAMFAAAYDIWDSKHGSDRRKYCDSLGLSIPGMRDVKQLAQQLDSSLSAAGYSYTKESDINAKSYRIIRTCLVSALAPLHLVRVLRPSTKYAETAEGAVEKDGKANELKFFTRGQQEDRPENEAQGNIITRYHNISEERVFTHPSSFMFKVGSYNCPWVVFHELVRTSKPFLRDATECSSYALLLFGGNISVQAAEGLIIVDGYARLAANARVGALIGGLRRKVDDLLSNKIENPSIDVATSIVMQLIVKLIKTDGLGT